MKITTTSTPIDEYKAKTVRVHLKDKGVTRLVEKSGVSELHIVIRKRSEITQRTFITLCREVIQTAKAQRLSRIVVSFNEFRFPKLRSVSEETCAQCMAENFLMANYEFNRFKEKPKGGWRSVEEVVIADVDTKTARDGFRKGQIIGEEVNKCRSLANTPGGDMTPVLLAKEAQKAAKGTGVSVRVLSHTDIEKLKMGAILGVAKGSSARPRFIIMEYWGAGKKTKKAPLVFVGKGITYDTGGLSLKPGNAMIEMYMDMSGGAAVIHAITAAARLKAKKNIIALIPAAENMVSGESYRPGDVLTTMSGKTVDVLNTDAEGRLVLADALTYAKRYNPRLVVDVATLTGAALVALGNHASAVMTKDEKLQKLFLEIGEKTGDYVWPLPLWDEYKQYTKGVHGDIANIPANGSGFGGSINGGMFLSHFTDEYPWVHIDTAPRMTSVPSDKLAKGAAGEPVRLLTQLALEY